MTDAQRRKPMTSRPEILAKRITPTLLLLALGGALLVTTPRTAGASPCKPDGQACRTNQSCCGTNGHNGLCVNSNPPGKRPAGACCTPATSCPAGQNCGTASDGCSGTIDCGTCPTGDICTAGTCCTPNCLPNNNCGDDGCGGSCGTCTAPATCTDIFGSRICAVECLYTCASGNQSFCLPRFHPPDCTVCTQAECDSFCTAFLSTCTRTDCNPSACQ